MKTTYTNGLDDAWAGCKAPKAYQLLPFINLEQTKLTILSLTIKISKYVCKTIKQ